VRPIRRILVAVKEPRVQWSPALIKVAQLARAFRAEIQLFHAITMTLYADVYGLSDKNVKQMEREVRTRAIEQLEVTATRLRRDRLTVTTAVAWDFPAHESIVRQARRLEADLILAEPHSGSRFAPLFLRPTDWELLRLAPVPVLLVKNFRAYRHPVILAAVDPAHAFAKPSGLDAEILDAATALTTALRGELHAMHAYLPLPRGVLVGDVADPGKQERQAMQAAEERFERVLRSSGIARARRHLVLNSADEGIRAVARASGCAVVVMGAVSRSGLKRLFIGNTAERTLDGLDCDVLVVKPRELSNRLSRKSRGPRRRAVGPMLPI
jgi:universal stress protein E